MRKEPECSLPGFADPVALLFPVTRGMFLIDEPAVGEGAHKTAKRPFYPFPFTLSRNPVNTPMFGPSISIINRYCHIAVQEYL